MKHSGNVARFLGFFTGVCLSADKALTILNRQRQSMSKIYCFSFSATRGQFSAFVIQKSAPDFISSEHIKVCICKLCILDCSFTKASNEVICIWFLPYVVYMLFRGLLLQITTVCLGQISVKRLYSLIL